MGAIDLEKFTEEKTAVLPMISGWGKYKGRIVGRKLASPPFFEDGWYKFQLGNTIKYKGKPTPLEIEEALEKVKKYRGLALGEEIVPWNFENLFRKGQGETIKVHFLDQPAWEIVKFVEWEDGRFYSVGVDYSADRSTLNQVKEAFEKEKEIGEIKGITPEIRYYFLLLSLQRQSFRQFKELEKLKLSQAEREKRIEEFRKTFAGRLQHSIKQAGGKLVRFTQRGTDKFTVVWKIGKQTIKSIIKNDMRIYDAGFCLSNERKQTMGSLAVLARTFQKEEGSLYITRE